MSTYRIWKAILALSAAAILASCGSGEEPAEPPAEVPLAEPSRRSVAFLAIPGGPKTVVLDKKLAKASGSVDVWVTLADAPVAAFANQLMTEGSGRAQALSLKSAREAPQAMRTALRMHRSAVMARQSRVGSLLQALGAKELGRVHMAHNAIAVTLDASKLAQVAAIPGVMKVRRVVHYEMSLSETVPYIGAGAVHQAGLDGAGVHVAVIDSGIDYTHRNLGGAGTAAAYESAYGTAEADPRNTTVDAALFPTAKVIGGFDFVGDAWPVGPRTEDPNPIDKQGHGTHVADIIAGQSLDGTHKGVAPGAKLLALKVCSSVASACNGVSIMKALDYVMDPNADGDLSDMVDVVNLSLGSDYGQIEDDATEAVSVAVRAGIVVVAAAGNAGNRPYIIGSPAISPGAIAVAQTAVPSESIYQAKVNSPASIARLYPNTATVDWAPIAEGFTGEVVFVGTACPNEQLLANPAGKVALIDRGTCSVSLKVANAAAAGATGVLLGLVAPGDAVSFINGGGENFVPTLVIQKSLADLIRANISAPVSVTVSDATKVALVGSMANTSSRGPTNNHQTIKPEIGAPGASRSAIAGSATGEESFGGTSGATPMVAGSAALLLQAFPDRTPIQIKAMLMNSASTEIFTNPVLLSGKLAPITRIGAGEVRVSRASKLNAAVWDPQTLSAALSFGAQEVSGRSDFEKTLVLENFSDKAKTFTLKSAFRFADDEASGAVKVVAPRQVKVEARRQEKVTIKLQVDGAKLPDWVLNGGALGGRGDLLDGNEFDGYITFTAAEEVLSVPWHILPRKAAASTAATIRAPGRTAGSIVLTNKGIADSEFDVFALTGISTKLDPDELPKPGDSFAVVDMRAIGVRYLRSPRVIQFAISSFGRRAHPNYPTAFTIEVDTNQDAAPDYSIANAEEGKFGETGANLVTVTNLATNETMAYFYNDADLNSANTIFTVPLDALGLTPDQTFNFTADGIDNYFSGEVTDTFASMTFTPNKPRYAVESDASGLVRARRSGRVVTSALPGGATASPSQTGFLVMMHRNAGLEAEVLVIK